MRIHALALLLGAVVVSSAAAQDKAVVMPAGKYTIEARDSTVKDFPLATWPFELKSNGAFTLTSPDGPSFTGTIKQEKGTVTYSDQGCTDDAAKPITGTYTLRMERGGFVFDVVSDSCPGHKSLTQWLFRKK